MQRSWKAAALLAVVVSGVCCSQVIEDVTGAARELSRTSRDVADDWAGEQRDSFPWFIALSCGLVGYVAGVRRVGQLRGRVR